MEGENTLASPENKFLRRHIFLIFLKYYSIAFKRVVMYSDIIKVSVDTDKT